MKDTQTIFLRDLLFVALRAWRAIIIVMVVLAVALGLVTGLSANKETDLTSYQKQYAAYQRDLRMREKELEKIKEDLENQEVYLEESLLQNLDPYGYYVANYRVYIATDYQIMPDKTYQDPNRLPNILNAYRVALVREDVIGRLSAVADTKPEYLRQIYEINVTDDMVHISVKFADETGAAKMQEAVQDIFTQETARIQEEIAEHTVIVLDNSVSREINLTLLDDQRAESKRCLELENTLDDSEEELTEFMATAPVKPGNTSSLKTSVKFGIIGAIVGAMLTVCWLWVRHFASGKVYSARVLEAKTNVKVLSCTAEKTAKCPVDRWLSRLEGRETLDLSSSAHFIAIDILHRQKGGVLAVIGNAKDDARKVVLSALGETAVDCGSLKTPQELKNLQQASAVVFLEQCGVSTYAAVEKHSQMTVDYEKQLIGCVLIDG